MVSPEPLLAWALLLPNDKWGFHPRRWMVPLLILQKELKNQLYPCLWLDAPIWMYPFFGGMRLMHTLSFRRSRTHCQRKASSVRKTYRQWDNLYPVPQMCGNSRFWEVGASPGVGLAGCSGGFRLVHLPFLRLLSSQHYSIGYMLLIYLLTEQQRFLVLGSLPTLH